MPLSEKTIPLMSLSRLNDEETFPEKQGHVSFSEVFLFTGSTQIQICFVCFLFPGSTQIIIKIKLCCVPTINALRTAWMTWHKCQAKPSQAPPDSDAQPNTMHPTEEPYNELKKTERGIASVLKIERGTHHPHHNHLRPLETLHFFPLAVFTGLRGLPLPAYSDLTTPTFTYMYWPSSSGRRNRKPASDDAVSQLQASPPRTPRW